MDKGTRGVRFDDEYLACLTTTMLLLFQSILRQGDQLRASGKGAQGGGGKRRQCESSGEKKKSITLSRHDRMAKQCQGLILDFHHEFIDQ